jgi:sugar phosphate isomerase/epimerase
MQITDEIREAIQQVYVTMPVRKIDKVYLGIFAKYKMNLELVLDFYTLDTMKPQEIRMVIRKLLSLGIGMTAHSPFNEIFLGAPDVLVREAAMMRLDRAFSMFEIFRPKAVVLHLGYEEKRFGFIYNEWFKNIIANLKKYSERCHKFGAVLSVENVYEENTDAMIEVFGSLKGYPVCHCMDVGHVSAFSSIGVKEWLKKMGPYIGHFHLHDNEGTGDRHAPIGAGKIDFSIIRKHISLKKNKPLITLEPHTKKDIWKTLGGYVEAGLVEAMKSQAIASKKEPR